MGTIKIISDYDIDDDDLIKALQSKKDAIIDKNRFEDELQNELLELVESEYADKYTLMIQEIIEIIKEIE